MKLLEAIKSAKRIEFDLYMGKYRTVVKVTKKDALQACHNYLDSESIFDFEWRDEKDEIIAQAFHNGEILSIGNQ